MHYSSALRKRAVCAGSDSLRCVPPPGHNEPDMGVHDRRERPRQLYVVFLSCASFMLDEVNGSCMTTGHLQLLSPSS